MNKETLNNIIALFVGAGIGSAVTWKLVKNKYKDLAQAEIDSVKEVYKRKEQHFAGCRNEKLESSDEDRLRYEKTIDDMGYDNISEEKEEVNKEEDEEMHTPYVISPEDYDTLDDYETESLIYYEKDHVLTDERDNVIKNVDDLIGEESLNHFGEFEDDSVFVRNDQLKTDFEICLDAGAFSEVQNSCMK